tara:strand:+ start:2792 stop:3040 length:249 start_codon:yes stop_codon:yes gene_type:complete
VSSISEYARLIVCGLVSDENGVLVEESSSEKGLFIEIKVSEGDVGKVIGKGGRIAESIRTLVRACGAKNNKRVLVNVFNKPR